MIHAIFVGQPKTITDDRGIWHSSIYRDPVSGPIDVTVDGLVGDKVTQSYHGGADGAICVHLLEHYQFWNKTLNMDMSSGFVGENLTLSSITESEVCVGDIVQVGSALIQVSVPRVPCANLSRRIGRTDWIKQTIRENRTGFYCRVLEPGTVQLNDVWQVKKCLNPTGTIPALNACLYLEFDQQFAKDVLKMEGLADWWKEQIEEKFSQPDKHWTIQMTN